MSSIRAKIFAGLIVIGGILAPSTAKAAVCPVGSPGVPITSLTTFFTCDFSGFNYRFDTSSQLSELTTSPTAALIFEKTPTTQSLRFTNLANTGLVDFIYYVTPLTEEALSIEQTFLQDPAGPTPLEDTLTTTPFFSPTQPTTMPFDVRATFEPDGTTLTQLTHTMYKTPAPLPVLGAGMAFGFCRKLRQRNSRAL
jgi:hypothetical protein